MKHITFLLLFLSTTTFAQKQKVWLDADTGNEMDDVYAIVRLLWAADRVDVTGLSSAHFNNADLVTFEKWNQYTTPGLSPIRVSQALNEEILTTMGLRHIPHPLGADRQMGRAWGGFQPRPSAATEKMLEVIKTLKAGEKLDILTLGALTNAASLIALDSTVKAKIRVFSLGGGYDFAKKAWNKNEFNVRCDLNAYDFMLNQANLDWTVMPIHSVAHYQFDRETIYDRLADDNATEQLMEKRWRETNPQDKTRTLWDLGLVQAYLLPGLAPVATVAAPPENRQPTVRIFTKVDAKGMDADFWEKVRQHRDDFAAPSRKPRLGDVHLGNRVGGVLAQEGPTTQVVCMEEGDQLLSIQVSLQEKTKLVKGFRMVVLKNNKQPQTYDFGATEGGAWQPAYKVAKGRELTGISGAAGWFVDRIRFHFDDGSVTPVYGGAGGDNDFQLLIARNEKGQLRGRWLGFWGSATDKLESVGLVFFPKE